MSKDQFIAITLGLIFGAGLYQWTRAGMIIWRMKRDAKAERDGIDVVHAIAQGPMYRQLVEEQPWLESPYYDAGGNNDWILLTPMAEKYAAHIRKTEVLH